MQEILEQYEDHEKSGRPAPYWVTEVVADALLYLKRPREAVKFYQLRLKQTRIFFTARCSIPSYQVSNTMS